MQNKTGDVKLERLVVTRWDGSPPPETLAGGLELQLNDGPAPPGKLDGYDPATKSFVVRGEGGESRVAEGRVARANVSPRPTTRSAPSASCSRTGAASAATC